MSVAAGRERPVKSRKKLWSVAVVGSATVPTSFGGHGGPPYGPKHFHTRNKNLGKNEPQNIDIRF
jgi:hypothetical protein